MSVIKQILKNEIKKICRRIEKGEVIDKEDFKLLQYFYERLKIENETEIKTQ